MNSNPVNRSSFIPNLFKINFALFSSFYNSNTTSGSGPNSVSNNTDSNPNTKNHPAPVSVEETTLNQTHDSVLGHNTTNDSNGSMNNVVKRSPR